MGEPVGQFSIQIQQGALYSVYFTDVNHGYAVGWVGTIIITTDGGKHWINQGITYGENLNSVYFISSNQGFIVGDKGLILMTTNAGANWTTQSSGVKYNLESINFGTIQSSSKTTYIGYIVGDSGTVLFSSNLGETWTKQVSNTPYNLSSISNIFTNASNNSSAFICGNLDNTGIILLSQNSGNNWMVMNVGITVPMINIYFASTSTGFVTGGNGTIIKTTDSGNHWTVQKSGTTNQINSVFFIGSDFVGFVVGNKGTILKTTDGGVGIKEYENGQKELNAEIYPNPVTDNAIISYDLALKCQVNIKIYNLTGKEVMSLLNTEQDKGNYTININSNNLENGIYFCTIKAGEYTTTKKFVKIRN